MPENPVNQCTSCWLVTSINEKSCKTQRFFRTKNALQAPENKGYNRSWLSGSRFWLSLILMYEISHIRRSAEVGFSFNAANGHLRDHK